MSGDITAGEGEGKGVLDGDRGTSMEGGEPFVDFPELTQTAPGRPGPDEGEEDRLLGDSAEGKCTQGGWREGGTSRRGNSWTHMEK